MLQGSCSSSILKLKQWKKNDDVDGDDNNDEVSMKIHSFEGNTLEENMLHLRIQWKK